MNQLRRAEGQWPLGYKGKREVGHDMEHMAIELRQYGRVEEEKEVRRKMRRKTAMY